MQLAGRLLVIKRLRTELPFQNYWFEWTEKGTADATAKKQNVSPVPVT